MEIAPSTIVAHGLSVTFNGHDQVRELGVQTTHFLISVTKDGVTWDLRKRFSQLYFLYLTLLEHAARMTARFPPKLVGTLSAAQTADRMQRMQAWFAEFLSTIQTTRGVADQLFSFFEVAAHLEPTNRVIVYRRHDIPFRVPDLGVIKAGYLTKLGGNKQGGQGNWKRRYFVLQDDIKYYETEQVYTSAGPPKGVCKLHTYYVTVVESPNPDHEFTIHSLPFSLTCRAESRDELHSWVQTLQAFCDVISAM